MELLDEDDEELAFEVDVAAADDEEDAVDEEDEELAFEVDVTDADDEEDAVESPPSRSPPAQPQFEREPMLDQLVADAQNKKQDEEQQHQVDEEEDSDSDGFWL